jgi:hypothetical protein
VKSASEGPDAHTQDIVARAMTAALDIQKYVHMPCIGIHRWASFTSPLVLDSGE